MEVEGELFYSPPHTRENEEGKCVQNGNKRDELLAAGEASLLLCLARERQISANLRKALENREAKLAATQRNASDAVDAQDVAALSAERNLLERRLQQEKRSSAELRRDLLTKTEESAKYKAAVVTGLKRLRETVQRERWDLGEHDERSSPGAIAVEGELDPDNAQELLESEIERLTVLCRSVQERQLREMRQRSQADRSVLQQDVETLSHAVAREEVQKEAEELEECIARQHKAQTSKQELDIVRKALEEQRSRLESKCLELERTRRNSDDQGRLIERLQEELTKLSEARESAMEEMNTLTAELKNSQAECLHKERDSLRSSHVRFSPKTIIVSQPDSDTAKEPSASVEQESPMASPRSGGNIEDLFLLPHRPRPRPKSEAAPAPETEQAEGVKPGSQPESHKGSERPRKKTVKSAAPMLEVHEDTVVTRTRSQTVMRSESSEIHTEHGKSSPAVQRRTRKITEVHD